MSGKAWRAIGVLGWCLLLIGGGVSVVLAYVDYDSFQVGFVVGFGWICGGIGSLVVGFDFIFRPGEPGPTEEYIWNRFKFVGATFALLGGVLIFVAIAACALAHFGDAPAHIGDVPVVEKYTRPAKPDSAVIAAWEKAGAKFDWMIVNYNFIGWRSTLPSQTPGVGDMPAFRFSSADYLSESIRGVPSPSMPFAVSCRNATDAGLTELAGMSQLHTLDLGMCQLTGTGWKELAGLEHLQRLYLTNSNVTDVELKQLSGMTQLQTLDLRHTQVTGAGLKELAGLKHLQRLYLNNSRVTDVELKELAGLKQLQRLELNLTRVTNAGLKQLTGLTQLQTLNLNNSRVTDAGLKELAGLTQLRELELNLTLVTNAGLKELTGLTQLVRLDLRGTKVTAEGVKMLKQALPNCQIIR